MFEKKEVADGSICGFDKKPCIKEKCKQWVHIRGKHPQSGAEVDMPDCALTWMPILMIESSKEVRQTAAAVESSRNEMATIMKTLVESFELAANRAIQNNGGSSLHKLERFQ